jgi:phosphatidylinositol glycan class V
LNGLVLAHDFFHDVCREELKLRFPFPARPRVAKAKAKAKAIANGNASRFEPYFRRDVFFASVAFGARCALTLFPLFLIQWFGYATYCGVGSAYRDRGSTPGWCGRWRPLPNIYAHVQAEYWNVGFLKYYEWKQVPNFAFAAPALGVSAFAAAKWSRASRAVRRGRTLRRAETRDADAGASGERVSRRRPRDAEHHAYASLAVQKNEPGGIPDAWMVSSRVQPYALMWAVMSVVALFAMHVQVATRFLSVTPAVYWFAAKQESPRFRKAVTLYCSSFFLVGALLFPTFYPWT